MLVVLCVYVYNCMCKPQDQLYIKCLMPHMEKEIPALPHFLRERVDHRQKGNPFVVRSQ